MIIRIRHEETKDTTSVKHPRCLSVLASETEDVKDNLNVILPHYPKGVIPFSTEEIAVQRLLDCFDTKIVKKKKKKKARRR